MPIHAAAGMDGCMLECGARNAGGTSMQNGKGLTHTVRHLAVPGKGKGTAATAGPDMERLDKFIEETTDRTPAMFFEGRGREVGRIRRMCEAALENFRETGDPTITRSGIVVLQGPPGSGKSSLAFECHRKSLEEGGTPISLVEADADDLAEPDRVIAAVFAAGLKRGVVKSMADILSGMELEVEVREVKAKLKGARNQTKYDGKEAAPSKRERMNWHSPVLLLVDEFQKYSEFEREAKPEWKAAARKTMMAFHKGSWKVPMIPVCAGLSETGELVKEAASSRNAGDTTFLLGALAPEEARRAVARMLDECRIQGETSLKEAWAEGVAEHSEGYPLHLYNGMKALAECLRKVDGDLRKVDEAEWKRKELKRRRSAYAAKISKRMKSSLALTAGAMRCFPKGVVRRETLLRMMKEIPKEARKGEDCLENFVDHLVHQGALQENPESPSRMCRCEMPSFQTYLSFLDLPLHLHVRYKDLASLQEELAAPDADPNQRDPDGRTALHLAAGGGGIEALEALLEAGADPGAADVEGRTPMHFAAEAGAFVAMEILARAGASREAPDGRGRTPGEIAVQGQLQASGIRKVPSPARRTAWPSGRPCP